MGENGRQNGWWKFIATALVAFLLGGGSSAIYSNSRINEVDERLDAKIEDDYILTLEVLQRLTRIETLLETLVEGE